MPLSRDAQLEVHLLQTAAELGCTGLCTCCRGAAAIHGPSHIGRRQIHSEQQSRCSWVQVDQLQLKCRLLALQQAQRRCHAEAVCGEEEHLPLVSPARQLPLSAHALHDGCTKHALAPFAGRSAGGAAEGGCRGTARHMSWQDVRLATWYAGNGQVLRQARMSAVAWLPRAHGMPVRPHTQRAHPTASS